MYPPAEVEIRAGEEAQISVGKNSELKHWNRHRLHRPLKPYFRTQTVLRDVTCNVYGVRESDQARVSARENRMIHRGRIARGYSQTYPG